MPPDTVPPFLWADAGTFPSPVEYSVPGAGEVQPQTATATFTNGSGQAILPALRIKSASGNLLALVFPQDKTIAAGQSAEVTWAPFRLSSQVGETFPRNMGELGFSGDSTLDTLYDHTVQFQDVQIGDGILVSAQAPSKSAVAATPRTPFACEDSQSNGYDFLSTHLWEASPPNVNEGVRQSWFFCPSATSALTAGVDRIEAVWDGAVYDRSVYAWLVRHDGGAATPTELAATADNDAAVFAATSVTLTSPAWTPTRDNGLEFATILAAKTGGTGGFGGVAGYSGFLQVESRTFAGSKQTYRISPQTYGANALVINPFGLPPYEIDLGQLPGGVLVGAFNGVGQFFTAGANAWKGITLFAID